MDIVVSKIGAVLRTRACGSTPRGEQGDTEGLVRHLVTQGHRVTYFGRVKGELTSHHVSPDLDDMDPYSPAEVQQEKFENDYEAVMNSWPGFMPKLYLSMNGQTSGWVTLDNPNGVMVRELSLRYIGPALGLANRLSEDHGTVIARSNADVRTYAREQELTTTWPAALPVALLDQQVLEVTQRIHGIPVRRKSVRGLVESWAYYEPVTNGAHRDISSVVIGHAHIGDGARLPGRDQCWRQILGDGAFEELPDLLIWGGGWEYFSMHKDYIDRFPGMVDSTAVMSMLAETVSTPVVPYSSTFYSSKPYLVAHAGCVPLFYGDGTQDFTFDAAGELEPLDSPLRLKKPGDLVQAVRLLRRDPTAGGNLLLRLQPNFSVVDQLVGDIESGLEPTSDLWWERYGGYRRL